MALSKQDIQKIIDFPQHVASLKQDLPFLRAMINIFILRDEALAAQARKFEQKPDVLEMLKHKQEQTQISHSDPLDTFIVASRIKAYDPIFAKAKDSSAKMQIIIEIMHLVGVTNNSLESNKDIAFVNKQVCAIIGEMCGITDTIQAFNTAWEKLPSAFHA